MQLQKFRVFNYRNIIDSAWIDVSKLTAFVGQNEAGKSNLFEALYRINPFAPATYNLDEDWPVDRWEAKDGNAKVCEADFLLTEEECVSLFAFALTEENQRRKHRSDVVLRATSYYGDDTHYWPQGTIEGWLDEAKVHQWGRANAPKFVLIENYTMSGSQVELNQLQQRLKAGKWDGLSTEDQTIKIILDLAQIDLDEFVSKGTSTEGRTTRSLDKRSASKYLTRQFQNLWKQKTIEFDVVSHEHDPPRFSRDDPGSEVTLAIA